MATFVFPPVTISTAGLATEATLSAINAKINDDYGVSSGAIRTAAQVGNATGAASFGSGVVGAQTLRVVLPTDQPAVAVTGPLTDTQLRAVAVPVSGPLTDTQLRATAVPVSGPLTDTQLRASAVPVSAASLPLPTGAATSANQATEIASLSSIDGKLPSLGAHVTASSVAVNIASDQTVPISAAALPLPTGASTSALQTTGNSSLSSIDGKLGTLGQKAMAGSAPVVIASDQSAIPVSQSGTWNVNNISGTISLPTGAATAAAQATINTHLANLDTRLDGGLVPFSFDYEAITYVGATTDISTVVYKTGGSGGTTVATLTMGYDGSNRLTSVTRT